MVKIILLVFLTNLVIVSSHQYEGYTCALENEVGLCIPLSECPSAMAKAPNNIVYLIICGYSGTTLIVCCSQKIPENILKKDPGEKAKDECKKIAEFRSEIDRPMWAQVAGITGGEWTEPFEFPHMAMLGFTDSRRTHWMCGGTLINEEWVMTAAHCTYQRNFGNVKYVRLGAVELNPQSSDPKEYFLVTEIKIHPLYTSSSVYNDIGLLKLHRRVVYSPTMLPACLQTDERLNTRPYIRYYATGWGATKHRGEMNENLLKVSLKLFNQAECSETNPRFRKAMDGVRDDIQICAGDRHNNGDSCQGDSGGPLQLTNEKDDIYVVVGIVSHGRNCGVRGQPSIYTRVSAFIPWIEGIVWP